MLKRLVFILLISINSIGQESHILEKDLDKRKEDTVLVKDLITLSRFYMRQDSLKSNGYGERAYALSKNLNSWHMGNVSKQLGRVRFFYGDIDRGAKYYNESIAFYEKKKDRSSEFKALSDLTFLYESNNEQNKAALKLKSFLASKSESDYFQALINNRLGSLTKGLEEYDLALEYYNLSDTYMEKVDTSLMEVVLAQLSNDKNRGVIYRNRQDYEKAIYYLEKSLKKSILEQSKRWMAINYNSLALVYELRGDIEKAIDYFGRSLELKRELNHNLGVITTLTNLGNLYRQQGNFNKAMDFLKEADSLAIGRTELVRKAGVKRVFSLLHSDLKEYEKAYKDLSIYNELMDSAQYEEKAKLLRELDAKYKNKAFQVEQDKLKAELEAADLREKNKTAQLKEQKNYIIFGGAFGSILLLLVLVVVRSNIRSKKANAKLNHKNHQITTKNKRIEEQSGQLKLKNKEILDSISYAKRIQQAILPPLKLVRSFLNDSFVLYLPKDIVAGDFYWMEPLDNKIIFAAADCTGHGVPGAMVSVICNNGLNRSVREFGLTKPSEILDKTREIVIQEFEKSEDEVNDGMDVSLVSLHVTDNEQTKIEYAGANNPLWIIRKGKFEESLISSNKVYQDPTNTYSLLEIKADKQPIGKYAVKNPYINRVLSLEKGDTVYLFSDGYVDQFGKTSKSKPDKKFKPNNFRDLLFSIQEETLPSQKNILFETFEEWKGGLEQVDDVCVIGVRL